MSFRFRLWNLQSIFFPRMSTLYNSKVTKNWRQLGTQVTQGKQWPKRGREQVGVEDEPEGGGESPKPESPWQCAPTQTFWFTFFLKGKTLIWDRRKSKFRVTNCQEGGLEKCKTIAWWNPDYTLPMWWTCKRQESLGRLSIDYAIAILQQRHWNTITWGLTEGRT